MRKGDGDQSKTVIVKLFESETKESFDLICPCIKIEKEGIPCSHIIAFCYSERSKSTKFSWDWVLGLIKPRWIDKRQLFNKDIEIASLQSEYKRLFQSFNN